MTDIEPRELLRLVLGGELDPIAAAEQVLSKGPFLFGQIGIGVDLVETSPLEALRFQAFMGRLTWTLLGGPGMPGLAEPTTLEAYRDFFVSSMAQLDDADPSP